MRCKLGTVNDLRRGNELTVRSLRDGSNTNLIRLDHMSRLQLVGKRDPKLCRREVMMGGQRNFSTRYSDVNVIVHPPPRKSDAAAGKTNLSSEGRHRRQSPGGENETVSLLV